MARCRAFTALTTLVTTTVLYDFYTFSEAARTSMVEGIMLKLQQKAQNVSELLGELKVDLKMIIMEWVMTLFCRVFQLDSIPNIWDILLAHYLKPAILEDLCVAVIVARREDILKQTEAGPLGKLLRNSKLSFSEEEEVFTQLRGVQLASQ